jgi:hypothetical protein
MRGCAEWKRNKQRKATWLAATSLIGAITCCWNVVAHALRTLAFEFCSLLARPAFGATAGDFIVGRKQAVLQNPNPVLLAAVLK